MNESSEPEISVDKSNIEETIPLNLRAKPPPLTVEMNEMGKSYWLEKFKSLFNNKKLRKLPCECKYSNDSSGPKKFTQDLFKIIQRVCIIFII